MEMKQYLAQALGRTCKDLLVGNGNMLRLRAYEGEEEYSFRTWVSAWQFRTQDRLLTAFADDDVDSVALTEIVHGKPIVALVVEPVSLNLLIEFSEGTSLFVMVSQGIGDRDEYQWSFHPPGATHLSVSAGGQWAICENE